MSDRRYAPDWITGLCADKIRIRLFQLKAEFAADRGDVQLVLSADKEEERLISGFKNERLNNLPQGTADGIRGVAGCARAFLQFPDFQFQAKAIEILLNFLAIF